MLFDSVSFVVTFCCSLLSKEVFEGAEGNLLRIFEKNRSILYRIKELPLDEPQPKERYDLNSLTFPMYFLLIVLVREKRLESSEFHSLIPQKGKTKLTQCQGRKTD